MSGSGYSFIQRRAAELRSDGWTVPFDPMALRDEARSVLPDHLFRHLEATPGAGATPRANRDFGTWRIVPRTFRDVSACTLETTLFGDSVRTPVMLAPIGRQSAYHPAGEEASARAAARVSIPFALSTVGSRSIETIASAAGSTAPLFQLYWPEDWEIAASLLERAGAAGYRGILLTVDFQGPRWVPADVADADAPEFGAPLANFQTDPVASYGSEASHDPAWDRTISWEDLAWLQNQTDLPIYLKGIVHPGDAALAIEHGADGIVVSNHGGRQADGAIGAIHALPAVIDAVGDSLPVLFDSGIRYPADAFKALALGADGVFLGRPYLYGLAINGETGVYEAVGNLLAGLERLVGLAGCRSVADIDRSTLRRVGAHQTRDGPQPTNR